MAFVALLVRVKLGAPVFFRQKRPGKGTAVFELIKFRTMTDQRDAAGNLLPDAVRLTPFGRWLRATSLDELPELFNVLRGDMSLVGPRPLLVQYLPLYSLRQARRHGSKQTAKIDRQTFHQVARFDLPTVQLRENSRRNVAHPPRTDAIMKRRRRHEGRKRNRLARVQNLFVGFPC